MHPTKSDFPSVWFCKTNMFLLFTSFSLFYMLSCGENKSTKPNGNNQSAVMKAKEESLTLYVQYESINDIKIGSTVRLEEKTIGQVEQIDENPDAFILKLVIDSEVQIPMLSRFSIRTDENQNDFIDIEFSNRERTLKSNDYFNGNE